MWSVVAFGLLAFVAHAEENAADPQLAELMKNIDSQEFRDKFADKFINKLFEKGLMENGNSVSNSLPEVDESALIGAAQQLTQSELDRAANRGTAYEWIKYNSEVDPVMAFEAQAAVTLMNERKARNDPSFGADLFHSEHSEYNAPNPSSQELAETSTDSMSLTAFALMACFVMGSLTLAVRRFHSSASTENKQALLNGYTAF